MRERLFIKMTMTRRFLGPITVFNKTIFTIMEGKSDPPNYLHFIGWVYLWSAIMHFVLAAFNGRGLPNTIACQRVGADSLDFLMQLATSYATSRFSHATRLDSTCPGYAIPRIPPFCANTRMSRFTYNMAYK